jgi:hypothetical protein
MEVEDVLPVSQHLKCVAAIGAIVDQPATWCAICVPGPEVVVILEYHITVGDITWPAAPIA